MKKFLFLRAGKIAAGAVSVAAIAALTVGGVLLQVKLASHLALDEAPAVQPHFPVSNAKIVQRAACSVKTDSSTGSGTFITGLDRTYVVTCNHVIASAKVSENLYNDVEVSTLVVEDGREVGRVVFTAKVIAASTTVDVAVLVVRSTQVTVPQVKFAPVGYISEPGEPVIHVGSAGGLSGAGSVMLGNVAAIGRIVEREVYDQTTVPCYPGCSGGGFYNAKNEWIGMVALAVGPGFNLIVPIREVRRWADTEDLGFLFK